MVIDANSSFDAPIQSSTETNKLRKTWMERMIETEEYRLKAQEDHVFRMTQQNEKDDTTNWLIYTG